MNACPTVDKINREPILSLRKYTWSQYFSQLSKVIFWLAFAHFVKNRPITSV